MLRRTIQGTSRKFIQHSQTSAALWKWTWGWLPISPDLSWAPQSPPSPHGLPRPQDDPAADLPHAAHDAQDAQQGGRARRHEQEADESPPTSELASHQGNREKMPPSLPPSQTQWKYQEGGVTAEISKPHPKLTPNSQWGYSLFDGSIWFMSTTSIQNEKDWHHDHCWGAGSQGGGA
ncbi:hypothetical protein JZ751_020376 [Albula glossodonta]|uniref:Uncharacterized protein n=1 Tax=Albula glossodonta TaxID=121402 RepID=A0A8T2NL60_9TELE|nr:hypothetical protein JZ751_020376 [Albula glossodonta]